MTAPRAILFRMDKTFPIACFFRDPATVPDRHEDSLADSASGGQTAPASKQGYP
jgi:hypothetical protein